MRKMKHLKSIITKRTAYYLNPTDIFALSLRNA